MFNENSNLRNEVLRFFLCKRKFGDDFEKNWGEIVQKFFEKIEKMLLLKFFRQNTFYICKKYLFVVKPRRCWFWLWFVVILFKLL